MRPLLRVFSACFLLLGTTISLAQTDTIRIMQYNLLNYGQSNNLPAFKDPRLNTIIQHVQPDILGTNEIANNAAHSLRIKDSVLGSGWSKGSYINTGNELQTNMLFWRTSKFGLISEQSICSNLRDIIAYRLYYKDTITVAHDTVFLTIIVAHLKASQGTQEEADRAAETQEVVDYLDSIGVQGNYVFMGDMNIYTYTEQAYQNVINSTSMYSKLFDPINMPGDWNADASFAAIHTQSTRTAQLSDGGANGGLDDRFDFQLVSNYVMTDSAGMKYIPNTYKALGQDGLHFNDSLTALPTNTSAPWNVIQALYEMSDHLPVIADYRIHADAPVSIKSVNEVTYNTKVVNPITNQKLSISFDKNLAGKTANINLYSITGSKLFSRDVQVDKNTLLQSFTLNDISAGLYFIRITTEKGYSYFSKIISY